MAGNRPKYLRADQPETWKKPDDVDTWGDWTLNPDKDVSFRHRHMAMLKASGWSNKEIAKKVGMTEARVSTLLTNEKIRGEIETYQDRMFAEGVEDTMKHLGPLATKQLENVLTGSDPDARVSHKLEAAKWLLEKLTGKAKQQVEVEGNVLGNVIEQLDRMVKQGKGVATDGDIIDIQPGQEIEDKRDQWEEWADRNLLPPQIEKGKGNGEEK